MSIAERMRHYKVPAVSVAVIDNYRIDWAKGYGVLDLEGRKPVDVNTLFQAGSISKPVAAAAALYLVEQGKLSLDEDVNRRLKSWKVPENEFTREQKVTLRRLLSHSAGLTVHGFPGYAAGDPLPTLIEVLDGNKPANTPAIRVDFVPGTRWRYSGGGYTIMQLLLTEVTGESFPELMRTLVLDKAGMAHSTYRQPLPARYAANTATGYRPDGEPVKGNWHTYPEMAAAGLWTTASDLARFAIEMQLSREGRSNRILSRAMATQMLTRQIADDGLGFFLEGTAKAPRFGHGGADEGFQAQLLCTLDSGKGAVVMTDSDNGSRLAGEILLSIAAAYGWPDYAPAQTEAARVDPKVLQACAGRYQFTPGPLVIVTAVADHLEAGFRNGVPVDYYPESETAFFPLASGFPKLTFVRDATGNVTALMAGPQRADRVR